MTPLQCLEGETTQESYYGERKGGFNVEGEGRG